MPLIIQEKHMAHLLDAVPGTGRLSVVCNVKDMDFIDLAYAVERGMSTEQAFQFAASQPIAHYSGMPARLIIEKLIAALS
jgi:hypothetical protein